MDPLRQLFLEVIFLKLYLMGAQKKDSFGSRRTASKVCYPRNFLQNGNNNLKVTILNDS